MTGAREGRPPRQAARERGPLTPRQAEVVRLAGLGLTLRATAAALGLSPDTVHNHRKAAYRRLGVASKTAAVLALLRQEREETSRWQ